MRVWMMIALVGLVSVLVVGVNFPLATALNWAGLDRTGLNWQRASGTIWSGTVEGLAVQDLVFDRVQTTLSPWPLVMGRADMTFAATGTGLQGSGQAVLSGGGRAILRDTDLEVDLAAFSLRDALGEPIRGQLTARIELVHVTREACEEGRYEVATDALVYAARGYGAAGFPLSGRGECAEGRFNLTMTGEQGAERVRLDVSATPQLDYSAQVEVRTADRTLAQGLLLYGFEQNGDRLTFIQRGDLLAAGG